MNARLKTVLLFIGIVSILAACSETDSSKGSAAEKEHFLTEKMQTIKKAEQVNQLVQDAAAQQRKRIDEESQ